MSFDPEKVERIEFCGFCLNTEIEPRVAASDYDQLLADYRVLKQRLQLLEAAPHPQPPANPPA
jgi:hypothetical protein